MALWPFRRKSRRKRCRSTAVSPLDGHGGRTACPAPAPAVLPGLADAPVSASLATPSRETRKLQRRPRTSGNIPARHDPPRVARTKSPGAPRRASAPTMPGDVAPGTGASGYPSAGAVPDKINLVSTLPEDPFWQPPTLHSKRDAEHLPRRKSSKRRRRNDPEREAEIKAMSGFVPLRPAAEEWTTGRPMKKETKRLPRTSFGWKGNTRHEWDKAQQRTSNVSLPMPESIHSAMSTDSEPLAFEVSAFDSLRPRPTLRYASNPKVAGSPEARPGVYKRPQPHRGMLATPVSEATIKAHKRIDDLANDLSTSDLRELMERDQRRRDRRRQRDQEKLWKRLERRAEKQRKAQVSAAEEGRVSPPNMERGVFGREPMGLGVDPASAVTTSSRRRSPSPKSPKQLGKLPERRHDARMDEEEEGRATPPPLLAFHRTGSIPRGGAAELQEHEVPEPPVAASPSSPGLQAFLRLRKPRSKSPIESGNTRTTGLSETGRKKSDGGVFKGPMWLSLFEWGGRIKRRSGGPSFFSNTSRDSMKMLHAHAPPSHTMLRKLSSAAPKRTRSRFREDLPELPLSPPVSPGASPIPPAIAEASPDLHKGAKEELAAGEAQTARHDTPISEHRSEPRGPTPSSLGGQQDEPGFSPGPHAMSLASIDSEASWLSGGRLSRKGQSSRSGIHETTQPHRESVGSGAEPRHEQHTPEPMSIVEDEHLARFSPGSGAGGKRQSTSEVVPLSDEEDEDGQTTQRRWGSVRGRRPVMVHSNEGTKSREVLVNAGQEAQIETVPETEHGVT